MHVVEGEIFLACVLSQTGSVAYSELHELKKKVEELIVDIQIDLSKDSMEYVKYSFSNIFNVLEDRVQRTPMAIKIFSDTELMDAIFLHKLPEHIRDTFSTHVCNVLKDYEDKEEI